MPKITKDVTMWLTNELHKMLTKVIMAKESHLRIYFIMVIPKARYMGKTAVTSNHLLHGKDADQQQGDKVVDLAGKRVLHNRLILLDKPPLVPMIGTSLWRIDNKRGEAKCIYILPEDKPIMYGDQIGEASRFIWKSAQGAPLIYSENN